MKSSIKTGFSFGHYYKSFRGRVGKSGFFIAVFRKTPAFAGEMNLSAYVFSSLEKDTDFQEDVIKKI